MGRNRKLRGAWDLVCGRFVADECHHLLDDDQLGPWPRSGAQMLEYGDAILVRPVVQHLAKKEDGDALTLRVRRLWVKEVVTFF